ncbi:MAG: adenosylcobinamide-GDP ribazoletransferase [Methylococcales bacterium]
MNQVRSFLVALQFLTILPVYFKRLPDARTTGDSLVYYPLVGLIIGLLLVLVGWAGNHLPTNLCAVFILVCWVVITGALHLDGLADSADAWLGGLGDRTRTLAIMKDPACGPIAVVTLVLLLLMKFVALQQIVFAESWLLLSMVPVLGRSTLVLLFISTPYVRTNGLGSQLAEQLSQRKGMMVVLLTAFVMIALSGLSALLILLIVVFLFYGLRSMMLKRLGGTTGDTAGAMVEISETVLLVVAAIQ